MLRPLPSSHRTNPLRAHRRRWAQTPSRDQGRQEPSSPRLTRARGPTRRTGLAATAGPVPGRLDYPPPRSPIGCRPRSATGSKPLGTRRRTDAVSLSPGLRVAKRKVMAFERGSCTRLADDRLASLRRLVPRSSDGPVRLPDITLCWNSSVSRPAFRLRPVQSLVRRDLGRDIDLHHPESLGVGDPAQNGDATHSSLSGSMPWIDLDFEPLAPRCYDDARDVGLPPTSTRLPH